MPTPTDSAPGSTSTSSGNNSMSSTSLVHSYFVFLALIIAVAGLCVLLVYRKRKRALANSPYSRENALTRDMHNWSASRGQASGYWQGSWGRSAVNGEGAGREEGFNELGEAPPAYAPPKTREEVQREEAGLPAVPLQAVSREGVGLKPPDWAETSVHAVEEHRMSGISGSGNDRVGSHSVSGGSSSL